MADPAKRRATYQDVLDAPVHMVAEIVDGELYTHPRPRPRHALGSAGLAGELWGPYQRGRGGPGGWWILVEPELHLGSEPDIVVPDLAGWRRERLPQLPEEAFFALAPNWACGILSTSTAQLDKTRKLPRPRFQVTGEAGLGSVIGFSIEGVPNGIRTRLWTKRTHGNATRMRDPHRSSSGFRGNSCR
jgi:hypothetical protein